MPSEQSDPIPFLPNLRAARDMVARYGLDLSAIDAADHTAFHALLVYLAQAEHRDVSDIPKRAERVARSPQ